MKQDIRKTGEGRKMRRRDKDTKRAKWDGKKGGDRTRIWE